jgi:stearoyl-CoA desaturase (delta-9 desaturase)
MNLDPLVAPHRTAPFEHGHDLQQIPVDPADEAMDDILMVPKAPLRQRLIIAAAVTLPFAGCVLGIALLWQYGWMGWQYLALLLGGWFLTGLGVTVGFHRLLTHRSFETYRWVRALWMSLGALSVEGSPLSWCAVHRRHHGRSDREGDPHSPHLHAKGFWGSITGFLHSHVGWMFSGWWTRLDLEKYVPDLLKDRVIVALDRCYAAFVAASLLVPFGLGYLVDGTLFGGFLGFLWGGLVRIFITHHVTWSINSVCHVFGRRPFRSGDYSTNNFVCGLLGFGEGWHNNHHAFPTSARHGMTWWQIDISWLVICAMYRLGLAWNIKVPHPRAMEAKRRR